MIREMWTNETKRITRCGCNKAVERWEELLRGFVGQDEEYFGDATTDGNDERPLELRRGGVEKESRLT